MRAPSLGAMPDTGAVVRQVAAATTGPEFSVPFDQWASEMPVAVSVHDECEDLVEACFLEVADDTLQMEAQLARAVLVTVTGNRSTVDLASAVEALHAAFDIGLADMSIRAFYPDDFLFLCWEGVTHDRMVRAGRAHSSWFEQNLRPWNWQAQATAAALPFLVLIALRGVLAHAWNQRTATVILHGRGVCRGGR